MVGHALPTDLWNNVEDTPRVELTIIVAAPWMVASRTSQSERVAYAFQGSGRRRLEQRDRWPDS